MAACPGIQWSLATYATLKKLPRATTESALKGRGRLLRPSTRDVNAPVLHLSNINILHFNIGAEGAAGLEKNSTLASLDLGEPNRR